MQILFHPRKFEFLCALDLGSRKYKKCEFLLLVHENDKSDKYRTKSDIIYQESDKSDTSFGDKSDNFKRTRQK